MAEQCLTGRTLGDYEVGRLVGEGGCGSVYRARRTCQGPGGAAGALVALKIFHPDLITDETAFQRFEREADLGLRIRHAHIVPTLDCGVVEFEGATQHYMAMEFVEGETLRDMLEELGPLPEDLLYQLADQILDALSAIHGEGMIHRDMKPENVIVTRDQQVRVMDLGVARLQQEGCDLTLVGEFVGSLAYAAPEQFTDQDHVDLRADLYAIGVLLYELATGVNPYDEPDLRALIEKKLRKPVQRARLLNRDLDPFLDEVIQTCLSVSPEARFASCEDLREVLRARDQSAWWQARIEGAAFPATLRALRGLRPPREAPLVGRDAELGRLHETFEGVRAGTGAVALISGPAGIGKSRLVHDFCEDLMAPDGPLLLAGRCPEEPGRAHSPFLEAVRGYAEGRADAAERLAGLLPADTPHVAAFVGAMFGESADLTDEDAETIVVSFLRALAGERPVVLVLEDLQWADPGTLQLLERVANAVVDVPVLLVVTWRPEDVAEGSPAHALTTVLGVRSENCALPLAPLDGAAVEALLTALVHVPRSVRALNWQLGRMSGGSPHFLLEIVRHLRDSGSLVEGEGGWIPTQAVQEVVLPESLRLLLLMRLVDVEPDLMQLLEAASAQGQAFDASVLASVTGLKRLRLLKRLAVLERKHGLVESAGRNAYRFASHGLWQVLYGGMRGDRRRECHSLCADAICEAGEDLSGEAAFSWVRHMLAADRVGEAIERIPAAVDYAATQLHATPALAFLEELGASLDEAHASLRFDVSMRRAALHRMLGHTEESVLALEAAAGEAERIGAAAPRGRVAAELAAAALRTGDTERARAESQRALALAEDAGDPAGRARALHGLGAAAFRTGSFEESAALWREAMASWEQAGEMRGHAATALELGRVLPEIGPADDAVGLLEAALGVFREVSDQRGEAAALNSIGNAHAEEGRAEDARACYEQSLTVVRELGDLPAEARTLQNLARLLSSESRIEAARETFERALDLFRHLGDVAGEASLLDDLGSALVTFGESALALDCLEQARVAAERLGIPSVQARVLRHLANVKHEAGDVEAAWADYESALVLAPRSERATTLADMGNAALRADEPDRAARLLARSVECAESPAQRLLGLARLARAHHAAGRPSEANACARQLEALVREQGGGLAPQDGPEIYYSLATVLENEGRGVDYLVRANELLDTRMRAIRTVAYRQHYLTTRWPNREILMEVRALEP